MVNVNKVLYKGNTDVFCVVVCTSLSGEVHWGNTGLRKQQKTGGLFMQLENIYKESHAGFINSMWSVLTTSRISFHIRWHDITFEESVLCDWKKNCDALSEIVIPFYSVADDCCAGCRFIRDAGFRSLSGPHISL